MIKKVDDFARLDVFREFRSGKPEAIFAQNKTPEQLVKIVEAFLECKDSVLITRLNYEQIKALRECFDDVYINDIGKIAVIGKKAKDLREGKVEGLGKTAVFTAGTSDKPVAEEACVTAMFLGLEVLKFYDVGIACIYRLVEPLKRVKEEDVDSIIAIAGMEGALPSVLAGLVDVPIIAVPTSVGYGVNLGGITTLFSMLLSCPAGVAVVNIDNGFGAGVFAYLISRIRRRSSRS
ncbi:nickel pincer cofactor biosynthesis protein LarB [Archaeoglobus profundus]|uniref:1-(5-phosphoribosyl)-5-amino-4-imidazole-carboxylate (AIR) carboxylase n=1 Tax=Archaeoglobus profundus (strain DSM 5631 / JCM 9629 / NBRC 100127 / Av18) TaxID=572546 RepID=D2RHE9_ARCPA|nr:nickel pincer cofactor biosynthesis protein LarB [Archaeoglobus profundus]ADB57724.1 1-(5-phosphoribosyl)-5-amino-4-imidazole- carboxylate (AIR) carboxylase [Archaeoglobus profundus DSM 5631]